MNIPKTLFFTALIGAGVAVPVILHRNAQDRLRPRLEEMQQQKDRIALLESENARLAKLPSQSNNAANLSPEQLGELLKLRSEVGSLRSQTNVIQKLREDNRLLRVETTGGKAASPATDASHEVFVPVESWSFAGYATPEATLQSFAWAMRKGDRKTMLNSVDDQSAAALGRQFAGKTDEQFAAEMAEATSKMSGYRVLKKELVSDDESLLQVARSDGTTNYEIIKLKKVNGEWKLTGM